MFLQGNPPASVIWQLNPPSGGMDGFVGVVPVAAAAVMVIMVVVVVVTVVRQGILHQTSFMDPELHGAVSNCYFQTTIPHYRTWLIKQNPVWWRRRWCLCVRESFTRQASWIHHYKLQSLIFI